ncbi:cysteine proteinase inhibitor 1-like [Salvia hispanica]|uniref:cysteine proteinase inhibitor 1-like n=1 Tax=Salvia hispanica TaxID=49212 RepID=UPI0020097ACA|nr:cysteine proteinase inhibitor 1-like [Salvia hispanica]
MASSMTMTTSFFGGAVATKPAAVTTRRSQLSVRASMDLEKAVAEATNTRRGFVLAGMAAAAASSVSKTAMAIPGGWTPQDPKAPEYFQLATFAVSEANKRINEALTLESVSRAETQVVAGTNYRLILSARDQRPISNNYEAIVFSQAAPTSLQLTSFNPLLK